MASNHRGQRKYAGRQPVSGSPYAVKKRTVGHDDESNIDQEHGVRPPRSSRFDWDYSHHQGLQEWRLFIALVCFRLINCFLVQTYFNPDEYWQGMEVAHRLAFGYGHMTWEWSEKIRGFTHPLLFAMLYKALQVVGLDSPFVSMWAPRLLQGVFAAVGDLFTYKLALRLFGGEVAAWTLICSVFSWFHFYCSVRTYSNSLESVLTVVALYFWPLPWPKLLPTLAPDGTTSSQVTMHWTRTVAFASMHLCRWFSSVPPPSFLNPRSVDERVVDDSGDLRDGAVGGGGGGSVGGSGVGSGGDHNEAEERPSEVAGDSSDDIVAPQEYEPPRWRRIVALSIAAFSFAVRPTSAILWIPFGVHQLLFARDRFRFLFLEVIPVGVLCMAITIYIDRICYGSEEWPVVVLNFLKFNVLNNMGQFYGTHPWHWYLSQGFTGVVLFSFLPLFLIGLLVSRWNFMAVVIAWSLFVYSLQPHKEFRFVLPLLPPALIYCGAALTWIHHWAINSPAHFKSHEHAPTEGIEVTRPFFSRVSSLINNRFRTRPDRLRLVRSVVLLILFANIPMAAYFSLGHQRGVVDVMTYLRHPPPPSHPHEVADVTSAHFLMPCHSTPYYSHIHRNISLRILDCSPPVSGARVQTGPTEAIGGDPRSQLESEIFFANPLQYMKETYGDAQQLQQQHKHKHIHQHHQQPERHQPSEQHQPSDNSWLALPDVFVLFAPVLPAVQPYLEDTGYVQRAHYFHSFFPLTDREGDVFVFRRIDSSVFAL
eukprot:TRINITY_DN13515_c0_g1_i1.p1 TRINITY_DN13515_c0_g1~~TRINITY_DN13515_c0_g1_i1.p1  ORF type:complete len:762 (+),score=167.97 TRINITY_DN13515_c0_g1_i1:160-2445(+)